jgi:hypothetical protein
VKLTEQATASAGIETANECNLNAGLSRSVAVIFITSNAHAPRYSQTSCEVQGKFFNFAHEFPTIPWGEGWVTDVGEFTHSTSS